MDIFAFHAQGLSDYQVEQAADCPAFTWNGVGWQCCPGGAMLRKEIGSGGMKLGADARFTVLFAQFTAADPAQYPSACQVKQLMLQTELDYLGDAYKITSVTIMGNGDQMHIEADSLNQAA